MGIYRGIAILILAAACSAPRPITQEPVPYTLKIAPPAERVAANRSVRIRAYLEAPQGGGELQNVPCTLESPYTRSEFVTPARVLTPDFGPATPVATLTCRYDDQVREVSLLPRREGSNRRGHLTVGVGYGVGSAGRIGVGVAPVFGHPGYYVPRAEDRFGYRDTTLFFQQNG